MENIASSSSSSNPNPLVFLNLPIHTKLNLSNYLSWQSQILPLLHGYDLYKFVHPISATPSPTILNSDDQVEFNPLYLAWHKQDQILLGWLRTSLSDSVLAQMVSCSTSAQLWDALHRSFSSTSKARVTELCRSLHTTTKGGSSCSDYIAKIRESSDELSFIGHTVLNDDLVSHILDGLGPEFNSFVIIVSTRAEPLNSRDLFSLLLTHECLLQTQHISSAASVNQSVAFYTHAQSQSRFKNKNSTPSSNQHNYRSSGPSNPFQGHQNQASGPSTRSHTRPSSNRPSYNYSFPHSGPGLLPLPPVQNSNSHPSNPYKDEICQVCSKRGRVASICHH